MGATQTMDTCIFNRLFSIIYSNFLKFSHIAMVLNTEKEARAGNISPTPVLVYLNHYTVLKTSQHIGLRFSNIPIGKRGVLPLKNNNNNCDKQNYIMECSKKTIKAFAFWLMLIIHSALPYTFMQLLTYLVCV